MGVFYDKGTLHYGFIGHVNIANRASVFTLGKIDSTGDGGEFREMAAGLGSGSRLHGTKSTALGSHKGHIRISADIDVSR